MFLKASPAEARVALGPPAMVANFWADFESQQYRIDNEDHDDVSHYVVFRRSTGKLVSVTRNYNEERRVDAFFQPRKPQPLPTPIRAPGTACASASSLGAGC